MPRADRAVYAPCLLPRASTATEGVRGLCAGGSSFREGQDILEHRMICSFSDSV